MTSEDFQLLTYKQTRELIEGRSHLLLGNGFSIGCDPIFRYESLYQRAVDGGLSDRAQEVFERLGTNNFEGVMRLLTDTDWVARTYNLIDPDSDSAMMEDVEIVKRALIEALAQSHLDHTGRVSDERKASAAAFISDYHNLFCTNYDLVLYWVVMHAEGGPAFRDGFNADPEDPDLPHLVFGGAISGRYKGMFFLHGALQFYVQSGEIRKHSWGRTATPITDLVRQGLERNQYPLFVAEGKPEKKAEQIRGNGYLFYCLDKLSRIESPLVIYGHGLGKSDAHILREIADNFALGQVFVGLYGDPDSPSNQETRARAREIQDRRDEKTAAVGVSAPVEVHFYDSETAHVWDRELETT